MMNSFSTDRSKAVPLLQFFFVCASVVSQVTFVLPLFVLYLSFFWCPWQVVLCDFGFYWVSLFILLPTCRHDVIKKLQENHNAIVQRKESYPKY